MQRKNMSLDELQRRYHEILEKGVHGLCFSLYEEGQKPGDIIRDEQIRRRMEILRPNTSWVRSFSCIEGNELIPKIAKQFGLKTLVGAWLSSDAEKTREKLDGLFQLAAEVDFISIHTYPVWEYKHVDEALDYSKQNYYAVVKKYPHKPVVITEAGWATKSNGRGIDPEYVNETYQKMYFEKLMAWVEKEEILTFFFEAFDESWKGSPEPFEPEKHWGLYKIDRTPKLAMRPYKEKNQGS